MAFWESELGKSEWFAGNEFTAADIQMSFPLEAAAARGGLEQGHPKAMAFLERILARPAYNRALEKGGPTALGDKAARSGCPDLVEEAVDVGTQRV
jgi:glutathione S-transferase